VSLVFNRTPLRVFEGHTDDILSLSWSRYTTVYAIPVYNLCYVFEAALLCEDDFSDVAGAKFDCAAIVNAHCQL
jgi:hypothetical protein